MPASKTMPAEEAVAAHATTSEALLAGAFHAQGFAVDWFAPRGFFARCGDRVHSVWGATTDLSAHAAVFALKNPNAAHELLQHAEVPVLEGRSFTRFERAEAHAAVEPWGRVTVHGGTHRPIVVETAWADAFTAAWDVVAAHATVPGMRVTRAPSAPGKRVLVAHDHVVAVIGGAAHGHRDDQGLEIAVAAVAALPSLDLAEVVIAPTTEGIVVVHIRADPDLTAFHDEITETSQGIADRIVALHLSACGDAAEGTAVDGSIRPARR